MDLQFKIIVLGFYFEFLLWSVLWHLGIRTIDVNFFKFWIVLCFVYSGWWLKLLHAGCGLFSAVWGYVSYFFDLFQSVTPAWGLDSVHGPCKLIQHLS